MKRKKVVLIYLWLAPLTFGLITLASFDKDVDDITLGFPEIFYSKTEGMNLITGQMGASMSFRTDEFLRDFGFALIVALIIVLLYARFKRKKSTK